MKFWSELEPEDKKKIKATIRGGIVWGAFGLSVAIYLYTHGEANTLNDQDFADWFITPLLIFISFSFVLGPLFGYGVYDLFKQPIKNDPENESPQQDPESKPETHSSCDLAPQLKEGKS
jgi:hypothetical protein